ncbi:hypothetical protein AEGHOMDF_3314 [Methylobacterium soli]|nr:hypothetical protein AEGHOMDF_3314 [Methylobacterium soli]
MTEIDQAGTYALGDCRVRRLGYGAMQLAGPHVFGPRGTGPAPSRCCAKRSRAG